MKSFSLLIFLVCLVTEIAAMDNALEGEIRAYNSCTDRGCDYFGDETTLMKCGRI